MNNQVTQKWEDSKWRNNARPTDLAKKGKFREVNSILEIYFKLGLDIVDCRYGFIFWSIFLSNRTFYLLACCFFLSCSLGTVSLLLTRDRVPLCDVFFSVLIFDFPLWCLLYKEYNLYIYLVTMVWNFSVVFYIACFLKSLY